MPTMKAGIYTVAGDALVSHFSTAYPAVNLPRYGEVNTLPRGTQVAKHQINPRSAKLETPDAETTR
jgi:hypothetical protein